MWEKVCQLCWRLSTFGVPGGEREKKPNKRKKANEGWEGRRRRGRSLWGNTLTRSCENLQRLLQALGDAGIWRRVGSAPVTAR